MIRKMIATLLIDIKPHKYLVLNVCIKDQALFYSANAKELGSYSISKRC